MNRMMNIHSHRRAYVLPRFNPATGRHMNQQPDRLVEYVAVKRGDRVERIGLALYMQDWWCRHFAHTRLHQHIDAAYMDTPHTRRLGFHRLLSHIRTWHTRELVVPRLDRLPDSRRRLFGGLAVRVVSATEPNRHGLSKADELAAIRRTISDLFDQEDHKRKGAGK